MTQSIFLYAGTFTTSILMASGYEYLTTKYSIRNKILRFLLTLIVITPLTLLSTVRYNVGTDYFSYVSLFEIFNTYSVEILNQITAYGSEPLFIYINILVKNIFGSEVGFFFITSITTWFLIFNTLDFFRKDISITLGLFISIMLHFGQSLNITRQILSASIVFFGFRYIYSKSFWKYLLCVIVATLFHNMSMITVIFYFFNFFSTQRIESRVVSSIKTIFPFVIILSPILIGFVLNLILNIPIFSRYSVYLQGSVDFGFSLFFELIPLFVALLLYRKNILSTNNNTQVFYYLAFLNIPFTISTYYSEILGRVSVYSELVWYLIIPLLINKLSYRENKIIMTILIVMYFVLLFIYQYIIMGGSEIFPYQSIYRN